MDAITRLAVVLKVGARDGGRWEQKRKAEREAAILSHRKSLAMRLNLTAYLGRQP